jgi:hypothetical protein
MTLNSKYTVLVIGLIILIIVLTLILSGECYGAEACNPTGNPIGGGAGYNKIISATDPRVKYTVSTKDQFLNALNSARSGDVIYVKGDANIDMSGVYGTVIPAGLTIASNRGENGSPGGRIFTNRLSGDPKDTRYTAMLELREKVRITGLRIEGPDPTTTTLPEGWLKSGIYLKNNYGMEVDNCEISGWSLAGVNVQIWNTTLQTEGLGTNPLGITMAYIHHNYIHHCQEYGLGYGITVGEGTALIEANVFDYTRHAVAGGGSPFEGYEARYNIHLGNSTDSVFDVHGNAAEGMGYIAGNTYKIHHNSMYQKHFSVGIRAIPVNGVWIDHNKFQWMTVWYSDWNPYVYSPVYQSDNGNTGDHTVALSTIRMYMTKNLIGTDQVLYPEGPISGLEHV